MTALDISDSVDPQEIRIEIEGIARAIRSPEVLQAMQRGRRGHIGFAVFAWHHGIYPELVSWTLIGSVTDAMSVSHQIEARLQVNVYVEPRGPNSHIGGLTDLSGAIEHATELLLMAPYVTDRMPGQGRSPPRTSGRSGVRWVVPASSEDQEAIDGRSN